MRSIRYALMHEYEEILGSHASPLVANLFLKVLEFSENVIHKDPFFKLNLIKKIPTITNLLIALSHVRPITL
jgi:hypothetical protein